MRSNGFTDFLVLIPIFLNAVWALPNGCGGTLGIQHINSTAYNGSVWSCAGISRSALFGGTKVLLEEGTQKTVKACGNFCAKTSYTNGLMAGIWTAKNETCECWYIGDLNYYNIPAEKPGVVFIDFYESWNAGGRPPAAQKWGKFTCPEGAGSGGSWSGGQYTQWCGPLTAHPAKPAILKPNTQGNCWNYCIPHTSAQFVLSDNKGNCACYGDLADLKVTLNYSSPFYVYDAYDFRSKS